MILKNLKLYGPFLRMGFNCVKIAEPLRGDSLLFTTQFHSFQRDHSPPPIYLQPPHPPHPPVVIGYPLIFKNLVLLEIIKLCNAK